LQWSNVAVCSKAIAWQQRLDGDCQCTPNFFAAPRTTTVGVAEQNDCQDVEHHRQQHELFERGLLDCEV
jgi:hypothetical protein